MFDATVGSASFLTEAICSGSLRSMDRDERDLHAREDKKRNPDYREEIQFENDLGSIGQLGFEDKVVCVNYDCGKLIFVLEGLRCRPSSDIDDFAALNQLDPKSAEVQAAFARVKEVVEHDFKRVARSMALVSGYGSQSFYRHYWQLQHIFLPQGKGLKSMLEIDVKPPIP
jgi:hypothetical protein